jgi:hypothetical protein
MMTFRSDAAADVMMFDDVARQMLQVLGKSDGERGVIMAEDLSAAIAALKSAAAADKMLDQSRSEGDRPRTEPSAGGMQRAYVSFHQRAAPLIELLERSWQRGKPVFWGR